MDLLAYLHHRVDAARQMMSDPRRGAEASGRLFMAKRCHEALKAGRDLGDELDAIEAEVRESLGDAAGVGVEREAAAIRARLQTP